VALVDKDGMATPYFVRQWQGLSGLPELLANGRLSITATDTQLTFSYRGNDGIVRSASLTLS
jgi:hypothetical protein